MRIKKNKIYMKELEKLKNYIYFSLDDEYLTYIFKDLLWGIIRYKERKEEDTFEKFRGFVEHCHRYLFNLLNKKIQNPLKLRFKENRDEIFVKRLKNLIFPQLNIKNIKLLEITRGTFKTGGIYFHEIIPEKSKPLNQIRFIPIIVSCIKLFLLVKNISYIVKLYQKKYQKSFLTKLRQKEIDIEKEFPKFFSKNEQKIVENFLDKVFERENRDKIFLKGIISKNDIRNSTILQEYYPFYIFEHWRIENILSEKVEYPFRTTGPHLIDFERGNWIYVPKTTKYVTNLLNKNKKSIIISAQSGTGKTVISRYVGYTFYKQNYSVFYIDCLEHEQNKLENVIDQLLLYFMNKKRKFNSLLFIFENTHVLDDELKLKLNKCKDLVLCLVTERVFKDEKKLKKKVLNFNSNQKIKIDLSHWTYKNTIKGMIKQNSQDLPILNQLKAISNQNLWIYAIILKLFKENLEIKKETSIIELFTNHELISESITGYYENLINKKAIDIKSSEDTNFLNHIKYFYAILSIFSEHELWTENKFLNKIIAIADKSPLGCLNKDIPLNNKVLSNIQSFLIDIFEIESRNIDFKSVIQDKEFKIPHSQMAIIYRNCFLKILEKSYPDLIKHLEYQYISYGKYYGSFLRQKYLYVIKNREFEDYKEINKNFFNFKSYLSSIGYNNNTLKNSDDRDILQDQFIRNSIEQNNSFLYYVGLYDSNLEGEIFKKIFSTQKILYNPIWKLKILESKPSILFSFLDKIKRFLGKTVFLDFIRAFIKEIMKKLEEDNGEYIFFFIQDLSKIEKNIWQDLYELILNLIRSKSIEGDSIQSFYIRNRNFFDNINQDHIFYSPIQKIFEDLILSTSLEEDHQFIPSMYYNNLKLFTQYYFDILKRVLYQRNPSDQILINTFEKKIQDLELNKIGNFLKYLYKNDRELGMSFFTKYLTILKTKLYEAKVDEIETFFDDLFTDFKDEKVFLKSAFLSNWNWFKGIFSRLSTSEFFYFFKFRILIQFFEELFPDRLREYKAFVISTGKSRIKEYYDSLENKTDIYAKLSYAYDDELNEEILTLFNISIKDSLKSQNLSFFTDCLAKFKSSMTHLDFKKKWDLNRFLLSDEFNQIILKAEDNGLKEFFKIFYEREELKKILYKKYNDFLIKRFGKNYKIYLKLTEAGLKYLESLDNIIQNLDLLKIIEIFNEHYDPIFPNKESYGLKYLSELINKDQSQFLNNKIKDKLNSLDFTEILNLMTIFKIHHPILLKKFYEKFNKLFLEKINISSNNIIEIITILEFYKLDLNFLKELDEYAKEGLSLFQLILKGLNGIDLCSLRYLVQINPASLLDTYKDINFSRHLKVSTLLGLAIFLYKDELIVAQKMPGKSYFSKKFNTSMSTPYVTPYVSIYHDQPATLWLSEKEFLKIESNLGSILILEYHHRTSKTKFISFLKQNELLKSLIPNKFINFSNEIVKKIEDSDLHHISFYLKSLKMYTEIKETKLNIPDDLALIFLSENFSHKIKRAEFSVIYDFFKHLKRINPNLAREIWNKNASYFFDNEFLNKTKTTYFYQIFNFYNLFTDIHFQYNPKCLEALKNVIRMRNLRTIIFYLLELSTTEFETLFPNFKNAIIDIAKNYSKFELNNILKSPTVEKFNQGNLKTIKSIYKEKLNEKYFFEQ